MTGAREDLVASLIQSCWLVEGARSAVLRAWGGEFAEHGERSSERTRTILDVLRERDIPVPTDVLEPHRAWIESLCGSTPTDVPLGAAVLQRLGHWSDVYMQPYLGEGSAAFVALGHAELVFPVPARHVTPEEVHLSAVEPLPGPRFAILTDLHVGAEGIEAQARRAVADINALHPDFVLVPGDITDDGEPEQFTLARDILDGLDVPCHAVLGNHDAVRRSTRGAEGAELFAQTFGRKPLDVVVECGGLQVALIDTTDPTASPFPDWDLARGGFREDAAGVSNGALDPGQAEALAAQIDPSRPVLLVHHHELQPFPGFPPVSFGLRQTDSDALFDALSGHRVVGVVAGHTHRSALLPVGPGVPQLEIPALKDWPFCYSVVGVTPEAARVTVHQIADRDLVWAHGRKIPPIYVGYVLGPLQAMDHAFKL